MNKIQELIKQLCPNGVEWKTLGEVCTNLDSKRKPITSSKRVAGSYPYYGASGIVDYVEDYIFDGDYLLVSEDGANLVARNTPIAFCINGKTWVNNHAHVLQIENYSNRRYIEIYLNSISLDPYISGGAQPKLNQENLNKIEIPYPPLPIQTEIVNILDKFVEQQEQLEKLIELRKKQYEWYREELLTAKEGWETIILGSCCEVSDYVANGSFASIKENVEYKQQEDYAALIRTCDFSSNFDRSKMVYVDEHAYNFLQKSRLMGGEIIINNIGAGVGSTFLCPKLDIKMSLAPNAIMVKTPNNRFYYYWFRSNHGQNAIKKIIASGSMPKFNKTGFKTLEIPVPSIEIQNEIVKTLDSFESSISALTSALELSKKRYEYYRDEMLRF